MNFVLVKDPYTDTPSWYSVWGTEKSYKCPAEEFFGYAGARNIFLNNSPRTVGDVIQEVKMHIADLKDDNFDPSGYVFPNYEELVRKRHALRTK